MLTAATQDTTNPVALRAELARATRVVEAAQRWHKLSPTAPRGMQLAAERELHEAVLEWEKGR